MSDFLFRARGSPGAFRINNAWGVGANGRPYKRKGVTHGQAALSEAVNAQAAGCLPCGPVRVHLACFMDRTHRKGPAVGLPMGDVDGPIKYVLDSLEKGRLLGDDAQITILHVEKHPADGVPEIWIFVATADTEPLPEGWALELRDNHARKNTS
jgi:Holliday junction resolvase RusA-like endonuclease